MRPSSLPLLALLAVAACGTAPADPAPSPAGTYALATINGKAPPQVISRTSGRAVELLGGSLVLRDDGGFSFVGTARVTAGGASAEAAQFLSGTWRASGAQVTFTPDRPGVIAAGPGQLAAATLTVVDVSEPVPVTFVFRK
jgi:hypothetical protein